MMKSKFSKSMLVILLAFLITLPLFAKGNKLTMTGSTTVLPIAQAGAEAFMDANPDCDITVRGGGSGVGIAALLSKSTDIANSSRMIKAKEIAAAKGNGINPVGYAIANDGIAIIVHKNNSVSNLTAQQLKDIYTGKISNWKQVGGPSLPIVVVSRDIASGTFEVFNEKALKGSKVKDGALMLASNNAVASTVAETPGAIGYAGLGYLTSSVKDVKINGIAPTEKTVKSGEYLLARKLYMYTNGKATGWVAKFIGWLQTDAGQALVVKNGFISIN